MKPSRSINVTGREDWTYRPAAYTDLRATFRRLRREQEAAAQRENERGVVAKRKIKGA